ncbi:hypothetical protein P8605_17690, partial [Streptomyces sp. T-3]|nr:hypothetical protein [Streptomyces sp. T-3]
MEAAHRGGSAEPAGAAEGAAETLDAVAAPPAAQASSASEASSGTAEGSSDGAEASSDASEASSDAAEALDRPLPEGVRRRVVQIVSDGFGGLTVSELPVQLRQYARFTPTRRLKFAGNAMAAALETDPLFRQRIGERLRAAQPELTGALDSAAPPPAADPLDVAAAAYVLRPAGWVKLVTAAGE